MKEEGFVEQIAIALGIKPAQLKTADVHARIPGIRRKVEEYEKQAVACEQSSLEKRAKAFSPDTPASERASLMRQATAELNKAKTLASFAGAFVAQLGQFTALETTMQIVDEMKEVGLIDSNTSIADWQKTVDTMQAEIQTMITTSQKLGDAMRSALDIETDSGDSVADELDELFVQWEAETDPEKKAEIQRKIENRSNTVIA